MNGNKATRLSHLKQGRLAELYAAQRLLEAGHEVFQPLIDDRGIDLLVRRRDGVVCEIQVKSTAEGRWFQLVTHDEEPTERHHNRWIACVSGDREAWVIPETEFRRLASTSKDEAGRQTHDLDLDVRPQGGLKTRGEFVADYREAWDLK